jgi:conjugal transfer pilus assembly protein TraU
MRLTREDIPTGLRNYGKAFKKLPAFPFLCCAVLSILIFGAKVSYAICKADFLNPITDICWQCIFPIRMGGIDIIGSDIDSPSDNVGNGVCLCGSTLGISTSFWEPARIIETVKDPYCFNLIGASIGNEAFLGGSTQVGDPKVSMFAQVHYYLLNVWSFLDLFLDLPCLEPTGFDVAYITEVDPTWNDDLLAFLLNPEAILFGNPILQMACMADSVASNISTPIDALFWCMGSWGSAYPLAGHKGNDDYIQDNAAVAAKMIYKLTRELVLWDTASNVCGAVMWPIWQKSHYRLQAMKPVRDMTCHPIGRSGLFWSSMKNPPFSASGNASDNFDWVMFRKKLCCIGWTL